MHWSHLLRNLSVIGVCDVIMTQFCFLSKRRTDCVVYYLPKLDGIAVIKCQINNALLQCFWVLHVLLSWRHSDVIMLADILSRLISKSHCNMWRHKLAAWVDCFSSWFIIPIKTSKKIDVSLSFLFYLYSVGFFCFFRISKLWCNYFENDLEKNYLTQSLQSFFFLFGQFMNLANISYYATSPPEHSIRSK